MDTMRILSVKHTVERLPLVFCGPAAAWNLDHYNYKLYNEVTEIYAIFV